MRTIPLSKDELQELHRQKQKPSNFQIHKQSLKMAECRRQAEAIKEKLEWQKQFNYMENY